MRKLLFILISLVSCSYLNAQTATNKVQNMATLMLTNSTLYIGGTNFVVNGTRYNSGEVMKLWGRDGAIVLAPTTPFHGRVNITWTTNLAGTLNSWTIGQDFVAGNTHQWGIRDDFNGRVPFNIFSNQIITLDIPLVVVSSNMFITNNLTVNGIITSAGAAVPSVLSTNVMSDFPLIAAASFSDISYPLTGTITNMVSNLGNPASEDGSLIVDCSIPSNGFVRIRARNVGSLAIDQGNLPYRIHVTKSPDQ